MHLTGEEAEEMLVQPWPDQPVLGRRSTNMHAVACPQLGWPSCRMPAPGLMGSRVGTTCGTCHVASLMDKSSSGAQHTVWHVHVHIHIITYCVPFSRFSTTVNAEQSPPHYTHFQSSVFCQLAQHQNQQ